MEKNNSNQFQLLKTKKFLPLFITQFLGAFNDNLFKTALIMLIVFSKLKFDMNVNTLVNICAGLFILPFFLFSIYAGQFADKYEKSRLIVYTKLMELILAFICIIGFFFNHLGLLLVSLFLLGTQATFFGPLKYSILPQLLSDRELLGGNGLIEMGTFIAILIGTIVGGLLAAIPDKGIMWVSLLMATVAIIGLISSLFIPRAKAFVPELKLDWNPFRQILSLTKEIYSIPPLFQAVIGISWFWLFGSIILTQIPNFTRLILQGDEQIATLILTSFSIGIGTGSILCEWLSHKKIEVGFVYLGCIGITIFTLDFSFSSSQSLGFWRILIDGFLMGAFGGLYLVPLYTLIQKISHPKERSRVIAFNNILNAIYMVIASLFAIIMLNLRLSIVELFILIAILNLFNGLYLYKLRRYVVI